MSDGAIELTNAGATLLPFFKEDIEVVIRG